MDAGNLRDKYDIHSWFHLYYDPRVTREEHWAMLLRHIKHLYEAKAGETYKDLAEILKGKNYYIVTTNQDFQTFKKVLSAVTIWRIGFGQENFY